MHPECSLFAECPYEMGIRHGHIRQTMTPVGQEDDFLVGNNKRGRETRRASRPALSWPISFMPSLQFAAASPPESAAYGPPGHRYGTLPPRG
jgi:hypothetical protein